MFKFANNFSDKNSGDSQRYKSFVAFTLAEVLITLGIIGIVAAMTIPTLMADYQKTQYVTQLKKAYTQWSQAIQQMAVDAGCPGDLSCFFINSNLITMTEKMLPYFKTVQICPSSGSMDACFSNNVATLLDGSDRKASNTPSCYGFVTSDGMSMLQCGASANCGWSLAASGNMSKICSSSLYIDVTGLKGPNIMGRDIFQFAITNGKGPALYPTGGIENGYWKTMCNAANGTQQGRYCTGKIIEDGWQMKY